MGKGADTRTTILDRALAMASRVGLEGLSIGTLAEDLGMSKSGLFAHFRSKEALQVQVIEAAASRFVDHVIRPALKAPRGEPRVRDLFERWLAWAHDGDTPGGCLFITASVELDDRPGPARDALVRLQRDWLDTIANVVRTAVSEGQFRGEVDPEQFASELYGVMLMYHHASRLLRDPKADARARAALDALIARSRR